MQLIVTLFEFEDGMIVEFTGGSKTVSGLEHQNGISCVIVKYT